jgi:hypothetical protein
MSKSVLVIDTSESCRDCDLKFTDEYSDYCPYKKTDVFTYVHTNTKPNWCPLSPLPDPVNLRQYGNNTPLDTMGALNYQYAQGYNDFREEILKGENK